MSMALLIVGVLVLALLGMGIFIYLLLTLSISDVDHETTALQTERMGLQNAELCQKNQMLRLKLQHQQEELMENRETLQRENRGLDQQLKERQLELEFPRGPCLERKFLHAAFLRNCNASQRKMLLRCKNEDFRRSLITHLSEFNFLNLQREQEQFRLRGKLVRNEDMWHGEERLHEENLHLSSQLKEKKCAVSQMYNDATTTDVTSTAAATASTTATVSTTTTTSATTAAKPKKNKRFIHWPFSDPINKYLHLLGLGGGGGSCGSGGGSGIGGGIFVHLRNGAFQLFQLSTKMQALFAHLLFPVPLVLMTHQLSAQPKLFLPSLRIQEVQLPQVQNLLVSVLEVDVWISVLSGVVDNRLLQLNQVDALGREQEGVALKTHLLPRRATNSLTEFTHREPKSH
ncbi:unnamed protein product [Lampetra planeri]